MLRTPTILGVSMVRRTNRRWFVALTYAAALAFILMAVVLREWPWAAYSVGWLLLLCAVISRLVFGKLVNQTLLTRRRTEAITLGLSAPAQRDAEEPDERELAVRNAAYFQAYRLLALYSFVFLPAYLTGTIGAFALRVAAMPLLVLALTLPQAVVLWTDPDVPEEAKLS